MPNARVWTAVYLIPCRNDRILLLKRHNTGYEDGNYSFVAGHIDEGESPRAAMIREAREEAGIVLDNSQLTFAHVLHRHSRDGKTYIDYFFTAVNWSGEPCVQEPEKCSELLWVPREDLPLNTLPYIQAAVKSIFSDHAPFAEYTEPR